MEIKLSLLAVRRILRWVVASLVVAGFLAEAWIAFVNHGDSGPVTEFFSLSYEENLSTWVSSSLLFSCAVLLTLVASARRQTRAPYQAHWWGLAAGFYYISLDELVQIHENLNTSLRFGEGALHFGWVVPATVIVVGLAVTYVRFLRDLPDDVRRRFMLAGAIYVGGALGTEFLLGYWTSIAGDRNFIYAMIDLVQESMELIGMSVFLLSLIGFFEILTTAPQIATAVVPIPDLAHVPVNGVQAMRTITQLGIAIALAGAFSASLAAQDRLSEAKQLYDSASYSEALSALDQVPSTASLEEVEKYRALCFLALNQPKSAEQTLEHLTMTRPMFTLDGADMSPRLLTLFQDVRRRTLPAAAKQIYQQARAGFDSGNLAEASKQFKDVVALADAAPQEQAAIMADLKILASGFLRLSEAPAPRPEISAAREPVLSERAAPAGVAPAVGIYTQATAGIEPPVIIERNIPGWKRWPVLQQSSFKGSLELIVSEEGTVMAATMAESLHPTYDAALLSAAKKWRFKPATEGGRPITYRLMYEVVADPLSPAPK